jgi:hypothetical protein
MALLRRRQPAVREAEDEAAVKAFVGHDDEAPGGIERHAVRVRGCLLLRVRARLSHQRNKLADRAESSIIRHRQDGDGARAVVGNDQEPFGRIQRRIDRVAAAAVGLVQQGQRRR